MTRNESGTELDLVLHVIEIFTLMGQLLLHKNQHLLTLIIELSVMDLSIHDRVGDFGVRY